MLLRFLLRKLLRLSVVLLGVVLITFLLMHAIPGNPWSNFSNAPRALQGLSIDRSLQNELDRRFGLDLPLWRQFTRYMVGDVDETGALFCGAVCGNLGPSIQQRGRSVSDILFAAPENQTRWESRFGYSIRLVFLGALLAVGVGVPLGVLSAGDHKSATSQTIAVSLAALISIPNFVLGLLTMVVLASGLKVIKVLPDWEYASSWIVPAIVLAVMPMASIARVTRASLLNILHEDFVRMARAKGLTQTQVMLKHVFRNALAPIITFLGPTLMEMFTGLLVVENLYGFPGFGREYWNAVLNLDYPLILGLTLIYAIGILFVNLLVEALSEVFDPRLRRVTPVEKA